MKKIIILFLFIYMPYAFGQRLELSGAVGCQFGGAVDESLKDQGTDYPGDALGINSTPSYGFYASYRLAPKIQCELSIDKQHTAMNFHDVQINSISKIADMTVSYYQVGLLYDWSQTNLRPFIGGSIGMADFSLKGDYNQERRLVASPILGVKIVAGKRFAFRLHTRVFLSNMPSGEIFCNTATDDCFPHHKATFFTQIQLMAGFVMFL